MGGDASKVPLAARQNRPVQEQWLPLGQTDDVWGWLQTNTLGTAALWHNFPIVD